MLGFACLEHFSCLIDLFVLGVDQPSRKGRLPRYYPNILTAFSPGEHVADLLALLNKFQGQVQVVSKAREWTSNTAWGRTWEDPM